MNAPHTTSDGRQVSPEYKAEVDRLLGELERWVKQESRARCAHTLVDALLNAAWLIADQNGEAERMAHHLMVLGAKELLARGVPAAAMFVPQASTRH